MGTKYTSVVVTGYNATPPSDDGAQTDANKVKWSYHKTKIGDPLNTAIVAINTALVTAFDVSASAKTISYTTGAGDNGKLIEANTAAITISLLDATTAAAGYTVSVYNGSAAAITVGRQTGGNTINGVAADIALQTKEAATFRINSGVTGYEILAANTTGSLITALPSVVSGSVFRKNCIINGAMRIAQRGTSFAAMAADTYSLDRWIYSKAGVMVHTVSQDTDVPTVAQAGVLFTNSLRLNLTTTDIAIAAGDFAVIGQKIEGYNFQRIAQRAFTASFWVKATATGAYSISFRNSVSDRSYVANFTVSVTATWEFKTINVLASPSAGTWNYTSGNGCYMNIALAAGSTFQTTAGAWQTGNFLGTASNVNGTNTGATDFRITGMQIEAGSVATEFDMVNIEDEISAGQRYYWKSFAYSTAPAQGVGIAGAINYRTAVAGIVSQNRTIDFPVLMRTSPTIVTFNTVVANANWRNSTLALDSGVPSITVSDRLLEITNPQVAGDTAGNFIAIHATADAEL